MTRINSLQAGATASAVLAFVFLGAGDASGRTLHVPRDFISIQEAIDASAPKDTVIVSKGRYHEGLVISQAQRGIVVKSESGSRETIIMGKAGGRLVTFDEADTLTELSGFTLRGGSPQFDGGAIYAYRSSILIADCEITGNSTQGDGGGIALYDSWALVWKNVISANDSRQGGGIFSNGSTLTLAGNTIRNNIARQDGGGGMFIGGEVTLDRNSFIGNQARNDGGGVAYMAQVGDIRGNNFQRNQSTRGGGFACQGGFQPDLSSNRFTGNEPSDLAGCASTAIQK